MSGHTYTKVIEDPTTYGKMLALLLKAGWPCYAKTVLLTSFTTGWGDSGTKVIVEYRRLIPKSVFEVIAYHLQKRSSEKLAKELAARLEKSEHLEKSAAKVRKYGWPIKEPETT